MLKSQKEVEPWYYFQYTLNTVYAMAGVQLTNFNIFEQKLKIESKRHSMKNKLLME